MGLKPIFIVLLLVIISENSCKDNSVGPDNIEPGRRDYTWTVDTLKLPMNNINAIWGASPQDIWAVGIMGTAYDRLLHYDGKEWVTYNKAPILCEGETLYGFSANDIWMGGRDGLGAGIWHYDGNSWKSNFSYQAEGAYLVRVTDIWGSASNDVYACGTISYNLVDNNTCSGFVLHYDGTTWKEIAKSSFNSQFITIRNEGGNVYIFALITTTSAPDTVAFYELNSNDFTRIYSGSRAKIVYGNLHYINGKVYFLISQEVYRYINGYFIKQFSLANQNFGYQFYGRNEKDIFLRMRDGLAHYNGTSMEYLYKLPLNMVSIVGEPLLLTNDVYFCLWDNTGNYMKNEILHGVLKN